MDINRLHYFCTVAQTGSLSRAAELLHISQPALSKALKLLESEVDESLFIPSGRGIAITDQGARLAHEARPLVEKVFSLKDTIKKTESQRPKLSLGSFEVFTTYFLGTIAQDLFKDYRIESLELTPGPLELALKKRQVDIGITYLPVPDPDLDFLKVASLEMGVFGRPHFFKKKAFGDLPFVLPNTSVQNTPTKNKGLDGWPDHKYPRLVLHKVAMLEAGLELARRGLAVGFFPKFLIQLQNKMYQPEFRLKEIPLPKNYKVKTKFDVFMIKRKSDIENAPFKKLARALRTQL